MKVYRINTSGREYEYWYDPQYRAWYAAEVDQYGNLGESVNEYTKDDILKTIRSGMVPSIPKYEK